jgi:hypothetical protein
MMVSAGHNVMKALEPILAKRLKPSPGALPAWLAWQHKTLNIHRGVLLHWTALNPTWHELSQQTIAAAQRSFKSSWWRGFGFGAVLEVSSLPVDCECVIESISVRAHTHTWQWVILVAHHDNVVLGIHTWQEGYLSPVYRELVAHFESEGLTVGSFAKEPDRLLKFLLQVGQLKGVRYDRFKP